MELRGVPRAWLWVLGTVCIVTGLYFLWLVWACAQGDPFGILTN